MLKLFRPRRAESLIETLVAITVIAITTTAAMVLIRTSLTGNEVIGEKIIAMNLALEGIEAVKNIRDTNYLRMSSDADSCWNTLDHWDVTTCTSPSTDFIEHDTYYFLSRNLNHNDPAGNLVFEWSMAEAFDTAADGFLTLYEFSEPASGATFELYAEAGLVSPVLTPVEGNEYSFQRLLYIDYGGETDQFNVVSTVNWWIDGELKTISLTRTIANVY